MHFSNCIYQNVMSNTVSVTFNNVDMIHGNGAVFQSNYFSDY